MKLKKWLVGLGFLAFFAKAFCIEKSDHRVDSALLHLMENYNVPVVGYAIIHNYQIVAAETLSIDPKIPVTETSEFQAASISKSLAAYGALRLVAEGKLNLDTPVNEKLSSWKIPENNFDKNNPVTLRQILSMTSGLSVSGFTGYAQEQALPTDIEILNGKFPVNNSPVQVAYPPGTKYSYSGGGYQVMQELIQDVQAKPFPEVMKQLVLDPLSMQNSHYEFPVSESLKKNLVPAFLRDGAEIKGGWLNYPYPAAAGLWSTPEDLAKFVINVSESFISNKQGLLPKNLAHEMLTRQAHSPFGLGVLVDGQGQDINFQKGGHNLGYHSQILMFPKTGEGVVIMTDSENGEAIINTIIPFIAKEYGWKTYTPSFDEATLQNPVSRKFAGL